MMKLDLRGKVFSRLFIIDEAPSVGKRKRSAWICRCQCGNIKIITTEALRSGDTKSCGCLNNEKRSARSEKMYKSKRKFSPIESTARRVHKSRYPEMKFEDFYELSQQNCYYCGMQPNNKQNIGLYDKKSSKFAIENGDFIYNGIDRVDNNKDHSDKSNCVSCCKWCNYSKRDRSLIEFKLWIKEVYEHFYRK